MGAVADLSEFSIKHPQWARGRWPVSAFGVTIGIARTNIRDRRRRPGTGRELTLGQRPDRLKLPAQSIICSLELHDVSQIALGFPRFDWWPSYGVEPSEVPLSEGAQCAEHCLDGCLDWSVHIRRCYGVALTAGVRASCDIRRPIRAVGWHPIRML